MHKMFSEEVVEELGASDRGSPLQLRRTRSDRGRGEAETNWWTNKATLTLLDPLERWPERRMPCLRRWVRTWRFATLNCSSTPSSARRTRSTPMGTCTASAPSMEYCAERLGVAMGPITLVVRVLAARVRARPGTCEAHRWTSAQMIVTLLGSSIADAGRPKRRPSWANASAPRSTSSRTAATAARWRPARVAAAKPTGTSSASASRGMRSTGREHRDSLGLRGDRQGPMPWSASAELFSCGIFVIVLPGHVDSGLSANVLQRGCAQ